MGNHKLRLSDMMPNAWFFKLKDMTRAKKKQPSLEPPSALNHSHPRKSYYFSRDLLPAPTSDSPPDPPRRSSKHRLQRRRRTVCTRSSPRLLNSSVSAGCRCRDTFSNNHCDFDCDCSSSQQPPEFRSDTVLPTESFDKMISSSCRLNSSDDDDDDTVINVDENSLANNPPQSPAFDAFSHYSLPPIVTKPSKPKDAAKSRRRSPRTEAAPPKHHKRTSATSPGVRLRVNSPKIAAAKTQSRRSVSSSTSRRSLSHSFAIVKSSSDPQTDFRDSMVEMILENNISASKDLEDLLACYLSLNSDEYHDIIIKVFKQIWFDLTDIRARLN